MKCPYDGQENIGPCHGRHQPGSKGHEERDDGNDFPFLTLRYASFFDEISYVPAIQVRRFKPAVQAGRSFGKTEQGQHIERNSRQNRQDNAYGSQNQRQTAQGNPEIAVNTATLLCHKRK